MKKKYGKPYLENSPLFFNASHSQGIMVVAVTYKTEVGLDIAVHCLSHKWKRLAKYILNKNEYVKNANEFYHVWALKESLLKATGEGLVHGASHLTFKPRHFKTNSTIIYTKRTQNWWSYLITSPIPNTSLALTSHSALNNIQLMNFVPDSPESE
jgi:4'-phosphopantetheinyl transferase